MAPCRCRQFNFYIPTLCRSLNCKNKPSSGAGALKIVTIQKLRLVILKCRHCFMSYLKRKSCERRD